MDSLRSILPKVLRKRGLDGAAMASLVTFRAQEWIEQILPKYRGVIRVVKVSHAVLELSCRNSVAAQECRYLLPDLLDFLRHECPDAVVTDVRISRGGG